MWRRRDARGAARDGSVWEPVAYFLSFSLSITAVSRNNPEMPVVSFAMRTCSNSAEGEGRKRKRGGGEGGRVGGRAQEGAEALGWSS